jgi:hypothetical protein
MSARVLIEKTPVSDHCGSAFDRDKQDNIIESFNRKGMSAGAVAKREINDDKDNGCHLVMPLLLSTYSQYVI